MHLSTGTWKWTRNWSNNFIRDRTTILQTDRSPESTFSTCYMHLTFVPQSTASASTVGCHITWVGCAVIQLALAIIVHVCHPLTRTAVTYRYINQHLSIPVFNYDNKNIDYDAITGTINRGPEVHQNWSDVGSREMRSAACGQQGNALCGMWAGKCALRHVGREMRSAEQLCIPLHLWICFVTIQ